jgi:hypothetical protein
MDRQTARQADGQKKENPEIEEQIPSVRSMLVTVDVYRSSGHEMAMVMVIRVGWIYRYFDLPIVVYT